MNFYFYFIEFSFPCLFNTTLLNSVGVNASKEAILTYFSSSSEERKIKRFSASSAEEIKIENPRMCIYTAPTLGSSDVPKIVNLHLLPSVYSLIMHASPLLSQAILQMTSWVLLPKVVPCLGQVWTLSTNALEDPSAKTMFSKFSALFPDKREWSPQKHPFSCFAYSFNPSLAVCLKCRLSFP